VSAELFPARLRSTCHGLASASGKAGAIVGTFGFLDASQDMHKPDPGFKKGIGYKYLLLLLAICAMAGFIVTLICIPETKGRSLEDLSGEDGDGGWSGDVSFEAVLRFLSLFL
jgi:PHS family inorganic phosphate transporter-like MFS transporter